MAFLKALKGRHKLAIVLCCRYAAKVKDSDEKIFEELSKLPLTQSTLYDRVLYEGNL